MTDFRFNPHRVRRAGLPSVPYAKALKALWEDTRTVKDMRRVFGDRIVDYLLRNGLATEGNGIVHITVDGLKALTQCGYPPVPKMKEAMHV